MDPAKPRPDFDHQEAQIGDPDDDCGSRIPLVTLTLSRAIALGSGEADRLANLAITTGAIDVSLVGLSQQDMLDFADFLSRYEQRMRDFS